MAKAPVAETAAEVPEIAIPVEAEEAAPDGLTTVTNCLAGTMLSLGDGRSIGFGESAEVSEDLALFLLERGQVK